MPKLSKRQETQITSQDEKDMTDAYVKGQNIDSISQEYGLTAYQVEKIVTKPAVEQKAK